MDQKKILIIDDEIDFVEVLSVRLRANDFDVIAAFDGEEGMEKASRLKPSLIILDIGMPKVDGYTFVKNIKADQALAGIPIIILTGRGDQMKDLFLQEGVADYMLKPFETNELIGKIRRLANK